MTSINPKYETKKTTTQKDIFILREKILIQMNSEDDRYKK